MAGLSVIVDPGVEISAEVGGLAAGAVSKCCGARMIRHADEGSAGEFYRCAACDFGYYFHL